MKNNPYLLFNEYEQQEKRKFLKQEFCVAHSNQYAEKDMKRENIDNEEDIDIENSAMLGPAYYDRVNYCS